MLYSKTKVFRQLLSFCNKQTTYQCLKTYVVCYNKPKNNGFIIELDVYLNFLINGCLNKILLMIKLLYIN